MVSDFVLSFQAYAHITSRTCRSLSLQYRNVRRAVSPFAAELAPRRHVHVKMRGVLTGDHSVVLNQVKPIGVVCLHNGIGHPADSMNDGDGLFVREVEKSRGMTPGNYVDLPELKLSPVHECECRLALLDNALV